MTTQSSMHKYLVHLLDQTENGEAAVTVQFKNPPGAPVQGALRVVKDVPGVDDFFEILAIAQNGPNSPPFPVSCYFAADEVARVMVVGSPEDLPQIVRPPQAANGGGIIIPT